MHIGAVLIFEGPPPDYDEFVEHIEARLHLVPRFRQKLAFPPLQIRAPGLGRRPAPEPRVPRAPLLAARAGRRRPARAAHRSHLLAAARPLQAAVGDVPGAGSGGQPLRDHQQDAPRARGRRLRRRPRDRPVRREPGAGRPHAAGAAVGAASPSRATRSCWRAASRRREGAPARRQARAGSRSTRARPSSHALELAEGRGRDRVGAAEPGARACRSTRRSGRTGATAGCTRISTTSSVKDTFGGTVNDVVLAVAAGRAATWLTSAWHEDRGRRAARARAGQPAHRGRARA